MFFLSAISQIAHCPPDHRTVLLFNETIIVIPVASRAGKGDLRFSTEPQEMVIDEFTAVIGVYTEQIEGQLLGDRLKGLGHSHLGLIPDGMGLCPARIDIGDVQSLDVIPSAIATIMSYQADLHKPWPLIIPVRKGPDRNLVLQERPGLCVACPLDRLFPPLRC